MPRGRKPKAPEDRKLATRKNVSLDVEAQQQLVEIQGKLTAKFGFKPTLNQVVAYLAKEFK